MFGSVKSAATADEFKTNAEHFLAFREDVITERTLNALNQHKATAHKLWGLALALGEIDKVIECIKQSKDTAQAEENLQLMQWNMDQAQPF